MNRSQLLVAALPFLFACAALGLETRYNVTIYEDVTFPTESPGVFENPFNGDADDTQVYLTVPLERRWCRARFSW